MTEPITWTCTILGAPRPKKNGQIPVTLPNRRRVILPNPRWVKWVKAARFDPPLPTLHEFRTASWIRASKKKRARMLPPATLLPAGRTWVMDVVIYREANRGDDDNYVTGLLDLLTAWFILDDDKRVAHGVIPAALVDKHNPRCEVVLREVVRPQ
jgi:Holliday junction resolvase RusA-like endonuclease